MPVKWTPENDQMLLIKILETSSVVADYKAISAAWPSDRFDPQGNPPTPRAISERIVKIRGTSKAAGAAHFKVGSAQVKKSTAANKATATPRKRATKPPPPAFSATPSGPPISSAPISNAPVPSSPDSSQTSVGDVSEIATPASANPSSGTKRLREVEPYIKDEFTMGYDEAFHDLELHTPSKKNKHDHQDIVMPSSPLMSYGEQINHEEYTNDEENTF